MSDWAVRNLAFCQSRTYPSLVDEVYDINASVLPSLQAREKAAKSSSIVMELWSANATANGWKCKEKVWAKPKRSNGRRRIFALETSPDAYNGTHSVIRRVA